MVPMRWTIFCRVIDNLGDAGVCWRLAADLAARGERVQLVIDDATPLRHLAPDGTAGVEVTVWHDALPFDAATDAVCEAFGCDPPPGYVAQMARAPAPPCWINLEYLSAEPYAERSHALPSPQLAGPARGLTKWFFFPGFTPASGGLLREPALLHERERFDRNAWLRAQAIERAATERVSVLFCYAHPGLDAWLTLLATEPTLLLVPQGPAQAAVQQWFGASLRRGALRAQLLPWLSQRAFDHLLWSADLNVVRGEDSLVRALWAGAPFVWQLYPQHDDAHLGKLDAFVARWAASAGPLPQGVAELLGWWNRRPAVAPAAPATPSVSAAFAAPAAPAASEPIAPALPALRDWAAAVRRWRGVLAAQPDLATRLQEFARSRRGSPPG